MPLSALVEFIHQVVSNIHLRLWCDAQLAVFSNSFMWLTAVLPYLVVAERYFAGEIEFGVISQVKKGRGGEPRRGEEDGRNFDLRSAAFVCRASNPPSEVTGAAKSRPPVYAFCRWRRRLKINYSPVHRPPSLSPKLAFTLYPQ